MSVATNEILYVCVEFVLYVLILAVLYTVISFVSMHFHAAPLNARTSMILSCSIIKTIQQRGLIGRIYKAE